MCESNYEVDTLLRSFEKLDIMRSKFEYQVFKEKFIKLLIEKSEAEKWEIAGEDWLDIMALNFDDSIVERAYIKISKTSGDYDNNIRRYIEIVNGTLSSTIAGYYWNYIIYDVYIENKFMSVSELLVVFDELGKWETLMNSYISENTRKITPEGYKKIVEESKKRKIETLTELWFLESEIYSSYIQWLPSEILETTLEICA